MHPELLHIPFLPSIKSYGAMMVVGFLCALFVMRRLGRRVRLDPILLTNAALYCLVAGIIGARVFYVLHHLDQFRDAWYRALAIWLGGLEFLGGVVMAVGFLAVYLHRLRLPVRRVLDIMAIGLMVGLIFGRVGCLLNGCCWGRPTSLPWGVRFPYRSYAYRSQIDPDPARGRAEPYFVLPDTYRYLDPEEGLWVPKPPALLSPEQRREVTTGSLRCRPVHPAQTYASLAALGIAGILYGLWRGSLVSAERRRGVRTPGLTLCGMLVLYGVARFCLERIRDDNPFEVGHLTISQLIGIGMVALGLLLVPLMLKLGPGPDPETPDTGRSV